MKKDFVDNCESETREDEASDDDAMKISAENSSKDKALWRTCS